MKKKTFLVKMVVQKEFQSSYIMMDICVKSIYIDDGVPSLNIPLTHLPMLEYATHVGAKELFAK